MNRKGYNKKLYDQHLERLQNIKSVIDNKEPNHLSFSKKWENQYNHKIDKINHSNTLLVNRLINVHSILDNTQDRHVKEILEFKNKMIIHKFKMNKLKIVNENNVLNERLNAITSTIKNK
jgi:hypothetical protein